MAGFKTHISVSTACGVAYGWYGATELGLPTDACLLAGGLCAVSGMLPDLDSDTGVPAKELKSFASAIIPMVAFHRMHENGLSVEQMVLAGAPMYLFIRFGLGTLMNKITVHRGMFHSIPALVIAAMLAFLICDSGLSTVRFFKAGSVALGFFSHLLLDEIWSVNLSTGGPWVKKSFGTAIKFFGPTVSGNSATYGLLILMTLLVLQDAQPMLSANVKPQKSLPSQTEFDDPQDDWEQPIRHVRRPPREVIYE